MSEKRRHYDRAFKLSAVRLLENSGKPLAKLTQGLNISDSMLRRWRVQVQERGAESFSEAGRMEQAEVLRLRREDKELRRQVEILKKTLGFAGGARRRDTRP